MMQINALIQSGKIENAVDVLKDGLTIDPGNPKMKSYLITAEMMLTRGNKDMDAVSGKYQELLAQAPNDSKVQNNYLADIVPLLLEAVKTGKAMSLAGFIFGRGRLCNNAMTPAGKMDCANGLLVLESRPV